MSVMTFSTIKPEPVEIQTDRVFYYNGGGFRHTWDRWELAEDVQGPKVVVYWGERAVELRGSDAYNFLQIVKSRHAQLFKK